MKSFSPSCNRLVLVRSLVEKNASSFAMLAGCMGGGGGGDGYFL